MSEKDNLSNRFKLNKKSGPPVSEEIKPLKFSDDIIKNISNTEKDTEIAEIDLTDIQNKYKTALLEKINTTPIWFEYSKDKQTELVKNFVENKISKDKITISDIDKDIITDKLLETIYGFGEIQYLLDNQNVTSVEINGTSSVFIEINGKYLNTEIKLQKEQLNFILNYILSITGNTKFNDINKFQTEKYRITVLGETICSSGINIKINKQEDISLSSLISTGILTENISEFITTSIKDRKNIIISGGTNTYKTTLITSLLKLIDNNKRVFLLEDNPITNTNKAQITTFKLSQNAEYNKEIISYIQKSEPDYIITDLNKINPEISAINGKIVTVKAYSVEDCLKLMISSYIKSGILEKFAKTMVLRDYDYIIHMTKDENGSTKVTSIVELSPQKTMALSAKSILKDIENKKDKTNKQKTSKEKAKTISSRFSD